MVQWYRVSTWFLQWLQVYTNLSWLWLCNSYNIHNVLYCARRNDENSKCLSRASVKNESRPSINSHAISGSGSWIGAKLAADWAECNRITKNTSLCFSIVAKIFALKSLPVCCSCFVLLFFRWFAFDLLDFLAFFWPFFLSSCGGSWSSFENI